MQTIGTETLYTFVDDNADPVVTTCTKVRESAGHRVESYLELARKIAHLQYKNRNHVLLFRGQSGDHRNQKNNTTLKPSLFRPERPAASDRRVYNPRPSLLMHRFDLLARAEQELIQCCTEEGIADARLRRQRILRWAILQHYEICDTPLLDVTQSLRIAASFASQKTSDKCFIFVLGVPNLAGAITASAEAEIQIVRLASVCPPAALRPHVQEGYLLGEYPEMPDFDQKKHYEHHEIDFGRRLVAKFWFDPERFWQDPSFPQIAADAIYPSDADDPLCRVAKRIAATLTD